MRRNNTRNRAPFRQALLFGLFLVIAIPSLASVHFPRPAELRPDVDFWVRVYTEIENGIEIQQLNLFGMYAFSPDLALTYDLPVVKHVDYSDLGAFKAGTGGFPAGQSGQGLPSGGIPFSDLDSDGDNTGMGDLNLRLFAKVGWDGSIDADNTWMVMPLIETTLPTATRS